MTINNPAHLLKIKYNCKYIFLRTRCISTNLPFCTRINNMTQKSMGVPGPSRPTLVSLLFWLCCFSLHYTYIHTYHIVFIVYLSFCDRQLASLSKYNLIWGPAYGLFLFGACFYTSYICWLYLHFWRIIQIHIHTNFSNHRLKHLVNENFKILK